MNPLLFTGRERLTLGVLALIGFGLPNGLFIWTLMRDRAALAAALHNPIAVAFMLEALLLLVLALWFLRRAGVGTVDLAKFLAVSLIGSLGCSVPLALVVAARRANEKRVAKGSPGRLAMTPP